MTFQIQKENGRLTPISKELLREWVDNLPEGWHEVTSEQKKGALGNYSPTRYKYYFDCVLTLALPAASRFYFWGVREGKKYIQKPLKNVEDLHEYLKAKYNSVQVIDAATGEYRETAMSTTQMNDRDFIHRFLEQILLDFSSHPFCVDIPSREDWRDMHTAHQWREYRKEALKAERERWEEMKMQ